VRLRYCDLDQPDPGPHRRGPGGARGHRREGWRGLLWTLYSIYFLWFLFLFTRGFRSAHGIGRGKSLVLAVIALIVYQGVFLGFNR